MRKSTLFISAVLTAFVMAMLAGVISAYQGLTPTTLSKEAAPVAQARTQPQSQARPVAEPVPAQAQTPNLVPEEAASLAAQVLGRDDLYSVELTDLDGQSAYMVTFSSGDLVYVSLDGQILSIGKVKVETVIIRSGGTDNDGSRRAAAPDNNHEDDDHEEEHEDDEHED